MSFSHLTFFQIPKRSKTCSYSQEAFKARDEIISRIKEGKGEYIREDFLAFHKAHIPKEEGWVYWDSVIPAKEKVDKSPKTKIARAMKLLHSLIEKKSEDPVSLQVLFVLSLFLQREKRLFLKREYLKKNASLPTLIFEEPHHGEVFTFSRPHVDKEEVQKIQVFLAKTLRGEEPPWPNTLSSNEVKVDKHPNEGKVSQ